MEKYVLVEIKTRKVTDPVLGIGTQFIYPDWKGIAHRILSNNKNLTRQLFVIEGDEKELADFVRGQGITELTKEQSDKQEAEFKKE